MTAILSIESDTDCERFDWKRGWLQEFRLKASMNSRVLIESVGDSESFDWKFRLCVLFCVWPLEFVLLRDAEHPSCTPASLALSMAARSSLSRISKLFRLQEFCFKADFSVAARCRVPFLGFKPDDCWIDCCQFFTFYVCELTSVGVPIEALTAARVAIQNFNDCDSFEWKLLYSSFYAHSTASSCLWSSPLCRDVERPSCISLQVFRSNPLLVSYEMYRWMQEFRFKALRHLLCLNVGGCSLQALLESKVES